MKALLVFVLLIGVVCAQPTIYSQLVGLTGSDQGAYDALAAVFDRAVGFADGDACLNKYFYRQGINANLRDRFIAFLCTATGGNSILAQSPINPGCYYKSLQGVTYFTENLTEALQAVYQPVHVAMAISAPEQTYFKAVVRAVASSFGLNSTLVGEIGNLLDATDPFTVSATTPRDCATVAFTTVNWQNPITGGVTLNINAGDTVCFNWTDGAPHTVELVNGPSGFVISGYGSGAGTASLTRSQACGGTVAPCAQLGANTDQFKYCHTWDSTSGFTSGTYSFDCGVHGTAMSATINVGPSPSPSSAATTPSSSSSPASTLSSFLF